MAGLQLSEVVANQQGKTPDQLAAQAQAATVQPGQQTTPTLANGQAPGSAQTGIQTPATPPQPTPTTSTGGLQMPANGANLVYDPTTNSQVTPAEKALNATKASGTPPPQTAGDVGTQVNDAINKATPPPLAAETTPNVDNFFTPANNPTLQDIMKQMSDAFNPATTTQLLTDQLAKITTDNTALAGLNTQSMNIDNLMSGTGDALRSEIQAAGGFATENQVQALTVARNKTLLQQSKDIQQKIATAQQAIANDTTLFQNEKDMANTQFAQRTQIYQLAQTTYNNMVQAQKDTANTIIGAIGYKGYLTELQQQGPTAVANAEKALGLGAGGLQTLVNQQQYQQNQAAIENAGITTPFVNKNGEIQSQTGYAYTSEQDFFNKTGMTIQQANDKGLVSMMKPPLDIQAKQADVALKNAQLAQVPLDIAAKKANIAQSYASAAASAASAAKTRLETQQLADGSTGDVAQQKLEQQYRAVLAKELNSRSGTLGTEDAKVVQANHLATMLNQYYDPKTGQYNVPKAQYGELVLGLAGMLSKTGTPTDSQVNSITQATLQGDIAKAIGYVTGSTPTGTSQAVLRNLADSISRQAQTAEQNRQQGIKFLQGLAPTDLDPTRRAALEQNSLTPYIGIKGIDNVGQSITNLNPNTPLGVGASGTFSSGITWKILP